MRLEQDPLLLRGCWECRPKTRLALRGGWTGVVDRLWEHCQPFAVPFDGTQSRVCHSFGSWGESRTHSWAVADGERTSFAHWGWFGDSNGFPRNQVRPAGVAGNPAA